MKNEPEELVKPVQVRKLEINYIFRLTRMLAFSAIEKLVFLDSCVSVSTYSVASTDTRKSINVPSITKPIINRNFQKRIHSLKPQK